jgi:hypothetical protein
MIITTTTITTTTSTAAARLQVDKVQHMTTPTDDFRNAFTRQGNRRQGVLNARCFSFDLGLITNAKTNITPINNSLCGGAWDIHICDQTPYINLENKNLGL